MALAGHEDIDIASGYYSNFSSFVESAVFGCAEEDTAKVMGKAALPGDPKTMSRVSGGWCDALEVSDGDVSECLKNYSPGGHLGDCYGCVRFHPEDLAVKVRMKEERARQLDLDWDGLLAAIDLLAKDKGLEEGLMAAMAKLKNSVFKYAKSKNL